MQHAGAAREVSSPDLRLAIFPVPLDLPQIEIGQFWHERVHKDQGHRWLRSAIYGLFGTPAAQAGLAYQA